MNLRTTRHVGQQGAVLIFSLIILLVMTLIGLSAMQNTTLEEKMSGNYRDQNVAFQAAESTLREGEEWIAELTKEPELATDSCSADCDVWDTDALLAALSALSYTDSSLWSDTRARVASITIPEITDDPKYYVEFEMDQRDRLNIGQQQDSTVRVYYGVVARGIGANPSTQTVLQSMYTRRF